MWRQSATTLYWGEECSGLWYTSGTDGWTGSYQVDITVTGNRFNHLVWRHSNQNYHKKSCPGHLSVCRPLLHNILPQSQPPLRHSIPRIMLRTQTEINSNHPHIYSILASGSNSQLQVRSGHRRRQFRLMFYLRFVSPRFRVLYLAGCTFIEFNILAIFKKLDSGVFS